MSIVATKVIRLDKVAEFANANFDRESGKEFNIPYAIEIQQHDNGSSDDRFVIVLTRCLSSGPVGTGHRTGMLPRELVEEKFKLVENSAAGAGPGIELLGIAAWYWLLSDEKAGRDLGIEIAIEAWDAWTLITAIFDGSKARDKFQHRNFVCPGIDLDQSLLCLSMKSDEHSIWLKRSTVRRARTIGIVSRWTFSKTYIGSNKLVHEEKHSIIDAEEAYIKPTPLETILKAKEFPFNP